MMRMPYPALGQGGASNQRDSRNAGCRRIGTIGSTCGYGLVKGARLCSGATGGGGKFGKGTVFEVTPPAPGKSKWMEKVLTSFTGGTVFELKP
jgi:hypothetical protein